MDQEKDSNPCNFLQILYDPTNQGKGKSIGDLDERLGKIRVGSKDRRNYAKQLFVDNRLVLSQSEYAGKTRRLYIGKQACVTTFSLNVI